jgi:translocator protein
MFIHEPKNLSSRWACEQLPSVYQAGRNTQMIEFEVAMKRSDRIDAPLSTIPMLGEARAVRTAREDAGSTTIEGTPIPSENPDIESAKKPPSRPTAALIALLCVAATSISTFVFTWPDMPRVNPTINYPWYVPTGPLFATLWLTLTICMAVSFYFLLRASPDNKSRRKAIIVFVLQLALNTIWAWVFFAHAAPLPGLMIVIMFSAAVLATIWLSARVDLRSALLLTPYLSWLTFCIAVTASAARAVW